MECLGKIENIVYISCVHCGVILRVLFFTGFLEDEFPNRERICGL